MRGQGSSIGGCARTVDGWMMRETGLPVMTWTPVVELSRKSQKAWEINQKSEKHRNNVTIDASKAPQTQATSVFSCVVF